MRGRFLRAAAGRRGGGDEFLEIGIVLSQAETFSLSSLSPTVLYDIDWGDGFSESNLTSTSPSRDYGAAGSYTIRITPLDGVMSLSILNNRVQRVESSPLFPWDEGFNLRFRSTSLLEVNLYNTASIEKWGYAFYQTATLTGLNCDLGSIDMSGIKNGDSCMWEYKGKIPFITFPPGYAIDQRFFRETQDPDFPAGMLDNVLVTMPGTGNPFYAGAWNATGVENIITSLDAAGYSNGNLNLSGGTTVAIGGWTPAALAAKASLESKGWTIVTN